MNVGSKYRSNPQILLKSFKLITYGYALMILTENDWLLLEVTL